MREDLKGQNLTFTEIAKLVGENWQNLNRAEKEPFERQAHEAKERYNRDLSDYKKTAEYKKYCDYLHEFRKRQAVQLQGNVWQFDIVERHRGLTYTIEKDTSKRLKLESDSCRGSSTSGSTGASGTNSGTVSGSDSQPGSEPPPTRQQRMGSSVSTAESNFSPGANGIHHPDELLYSPRTLSHEELNSGRSRGLSSPTSREPPVHHPSRRSGWGDGQRMYGESTNTGISWFDPRSVQGNPVQSPEGGLSSFGHGSGRGSRSSVSSSISRPSLQTEQSSTGSVSSLNSYSIPRTPSDASLPIHALLSSKPEPPYISQGQMPAHQLQSGRPPGDPSSGSSIETHTNGPLPSNDLMPSDLTTDISSRIFLKTARSKICDARFTEGSRFRCICWVNSTYYFETDRYG